jgi:hypothetical protein
MTTNKIDTRAESPAGAPVEPAISALYPEVGRIMLFVAFEEADSEAEPNYQQIIFTRDTEASFHLDCSRDDCAGGGFDFSPYVGSLIRSGESRAHGKLVCQGLLEGGAGGHCCLNAEYRIIVEYDD